MCRCPSKWKDGIRFEPCLVLGKPEQPRGTKVGESEGPIVGVPSGILEGQGSESGLGRCLETCGVIPLQSSLGSWYTLKCGNWWDSGTMENL